MCLHVPRIACHSCVVAKLVDLDVVETSGVDAPAHLDPGWLVIKSEGAAVSDETPVVEDTQEPTVEQLNAKIADLEAALAASDVPVEAEESVEELAKAAPEPLAKAFADMSERLEKAEAQLQVARDAEELARAESFVKSLDRLALPDTAAALIKNLRTVAPSLAGDVEGLLTAVNGQTDSAELFKELGSAGATSSSDPYDKWNALAKAKMDAGDATTIQQARSLVALENPDLYNEMKG